MKKYMRHNSISTFIQSVLIVALFCVPLGSVQAAIPVAPQSPAGAASVKIQTYSGVNGVFTGDWATALTAGTISAANNLGTLKSALDSGNFMGVRAGYFDFKDSSGNVETYAIVNGAGFVEVAGSPLLPITLLSPNPHAGEYLISDTNVVNPNLIANYDDWVMMLDTDGSTSAYWKGNGGLVAGADYTYTTLTGGPYAGVAMSALAAHPKFVDGENLNYVMLNTAGTGAELYSVITGAYVGPYGVVTPLSGGPLNGSTLQDAVTDVNPAHKFLGAGQLGYVFMNVSTGALFYYDYVLLLHVPLATTLTGGPFAGPINTAVTGGRFLGVSDAEIEFIDDVGQLQQYSVITGVGPATFPVQPLEGPQVTETAFNADFVDSTDNGYAFVDADGTLSVYLAAARTLFVDTKFKTFTGGGVLNNVAPVAGRSTANILAVENGTYYALGLDGSLEGYNGITGAYGDVWTWTTMTGGKLDGETLASAVNNNVPGVTFLGISGAELVFAVSADPGINVTGNPVLAEAGAPGSLNVTLNSAPAAPVDVTLVFQNGQATSTPTTLTFTSANYSTPQIVTVSAIDDVVFEGAHVDTIGFTASSSDAQYNGIASTSAKMVSIADNDVVVEFSTSTTSDLETNAGALIPTKAKLLVKGVLPVAATVNIVKTGGTATLSSDYTGIATTTTVTIPAATYDGTLATAIDLSAVFALVILGDTAFEVNETIAFMLATSTGSALIGDANSSTSTQSTWEYSIVNDDLPSVLFVEFTSATSSNAEGDVGTTTLTNFPKLSVFGTAASPSVVNVVINGAPTPMAIPAGAYTVGSTVDIPAPTIIGNVSVEVDQVFALSFGTTTGVAVINDSNGDSTTQATSTFTVTNDDAPVTLSFMGGSASVGEASTSTGATVYVLIQGTVKATTTVSVLAPTGTATNGTDYATTTIVNLIVVPGVYDGSTTTAQTFTLPTPINDTVYEGNETVVFNFGTTTSPFTVSTTSPTFTYTIVDDEVPPAPAPVTSGGGGGGGGGNGPIVGSLTQNSVPGPQGLVLGASTTTTGTSAPHCDKKIKRPIKFGAQNDVADVTLLQQYLNTREGESLNVSGIYDQATLAAVHRYQNKYFDSVIKPWNLTYTTGYVYKTTLAHMNARMCGNFSCKPFNQYYMVGQTGGEISKVQSFLNDMGYYLGTSNGVFDLNLKTAISAFQSEFSGVVLAPWGLQQPTGRWYKTSRKLANSMLGCFETVTVLSKTY